MPNGHKRLVGYQVPRSNKFVIRIVFTTVIMTLAILAILPFTQALSGDPRDRTLRSVDTANLPPPEPPPPEPPPPPEEEEQEEIEFEDEPPPLNLSALESMLNPGVGSAMGAVLDFNSFAVRPDALQEMQIFEIADLDRTPRRLKGRPPAYPPNLLRIKAEGEVDLILILNEQGRVTIESANVDGHRDFLQSVRQAASSWIFEPPMKDGQPVRARYRMTIPFQL
jgi:protein TonB